MDIENVMRSTNKRLFKGLLLAVLALALIFYFMAFFTRGAEFDDTFLKKEVVSSDAHYMGKNMYGSIHITVKGIKDVHRSAEVEFRLPNNINSRYTVNFKDPKNWDAGIENIKDGDGNIVFEGEYRKGRDFMVDKNGEFWLDYNARVITYGESPYNEYYKISLKNVADFAYSAKDTTRGNYQLLVLALFFLAITIIDIKYPLFFFNWKYSFSVENPQPSDTYLALQKISWVAYPAIAVFLMIAMIC
ncbi:MAG TPA: hypothetical protein PK684_07665 [Bacillota bacterium]|nr:hypothetical protein [Bacillota bacterium]